MAQLTLWVVEGDQGLFEGHRDTGKGERQMHGWPSLVRTVGNHQPLMPPLDELTDVT
jgi:hypothetical protein